MKKYLCIRTCQLRIDDQIHFIEKHAVRTLAEDPGKNFRCLTVDDETNEAPYEVDFTTAERAELLEARWNMKQAKAAVQEAYGVELISVEGDRKTDVVDRILDARYRASDLKASVSPS